MGRRTVGPVACLAAIATLACAGNPVGDGGPALTFAVDSVSVLVGGTTSASASVRNTTAQAQFTSRDLSVATVTASGAITGVAVGSTFVVANLTSDAEVRDSVRVVVKAFVPDTCAVARPDFGGAATAADRALFEYDASAPLNLVKTLTSTPTGARVSSISYASPGGGSVPGIMTEPVGREGLRPGMVILPPSGGGSAGMTPYATFLAQQGAVVVVIDAPYLRRGGTSVPVFTTTDRLEQIQLMKDLQRAVDVLRAHPDVDHGRIGFEGYSYGGIMGAQFVGIERRLKAAVLAAAHGGNVTGITTAPNLNYLATNVTCAARNAWFRDMVPIEPIRYIANAAPTEVLFQIARFDMAVLLDDAQALFNAASDPKEVMYYDTGHGFNAQALTDRHQWIHQKLGIDPPA